MTIERLVHCQRPRSSCLSPRRHWLHLKHLEEAIFASNHDPPLLVMVDSSNPKVETSDKAILTATSVQKNKKG
jgi:hypothetical protein